MSQHPATEFLHALDPASDATFHITTLTDLPKGEEKPKLDPLLRHYENQTLVQVKGLIPELERLNATGAGIFFCVNQCKGKRKKANVTRVRCVHADFDNATLAQIDAVRQKLPPSIEVHTSGTTKHLGLVKQQLPFSQVNHAVLHTEQHRVRVQFPVGNGHPRFRHCHFQHSHNFGQAVRKYGVRNKFAFRLIAGERRRC